MNTAQRYAGGGHYATTTSRTVSSDHTAPLLADNRQAVNLSLSCAQKASGNLSEVEHLYWALRNRCNDLLRQMTDEYASGDDSAALLTLDEHTTVSGMLDQLFEATQAPPF